MNWAYTEDEVRTWYASVFPSWDFGIVAETATEVIGFVAASGGHIDQLFVDPDHQKHGIGTSLLTEALRRMPTLVTLTVFEANRHARRFYESHGFREAGAFINEREQAVELVYRRDAVVETLHGLPTL